MTFWQTVIGLAFGLLWFGFGVAWQMRGESERIAQAVKAAEKRSLRRFLGLMDKYSSKPDRECIPGRDQLDDELPEPCCFAYAPATETGD